MRLRGKCFSFADNRCVFCTLSFRRSFTLSVFSPSLNAKHLIIHLTSLPYVAQTGHSVLREFSADAEHDNTLHYVHAKIDSIPPRATTTLYLGIKVRRTGMNNQLIVYLVLTTRRKVRPTINFGQTTTVVVCK